MSIYSKFNHFVTDWRAARNQARTYRIIRSLPSEIQKDIGWPDIHVDHSKHRFATGSWAGGK